MSTTTQDIVLKVPDIPKSIIEYLERLYPESCPRMDWSERKIWVEVGKREVVKALKARFEEQQQEGV